MDWWAVLGYSLPLSRLSFPSSCSPCTRCAQASQIPFADGFPHSIQTGLRFLLKAPPPAC